MKNFKTILIAFLTFMILTSESSCHQEVQSASGVKKADVKNVQTDINGNTQEQLNVIKRIEEDNKIGGIKHLYIISPYTGSVLMYSTVAGKVTSSGKRLTPSSIDGETTGFQFDVNGTQHYTKQMLNDDGTYGSTTSSDYIYWWDTNGIGHRHYIVGGQIIHISNEPLNVEPIINLSSNSKK